MEERVSGGNEMRRGGDGGARGSSKSDYAHTYSALVS